jgi:hypothetical protein
MVGWFTWGKTQPGELEKEIKKEKAGLTPLEVESLPRNTKNFL